VNNENKRKGIHSVTSFKVIRARAENRKGGAKALTELLPSGPSSKSLIKLRDDRVLAEMARRVFCAGFAWRVIDSKWSGFEEAFLGLGSRGRALSHRTATGRIVSQSARTGRDTTFSCHDAAGSRACFREMR